MASIHIVKFDMHMSSDVLCIYIKYHNLISCHIVDLYRPHGYDIAYIISMHHNSPHYSSLIDAQQSILHVLNRFEVDPIKR